MSVHISDSAVFKNAWGTPALRVLFEDTALLKGWLDVMVVLARTQAEFGLIPADAAERIAVAVDNLVIDTEFLDEVRCGYEQSNHSLLGLIRATAKRCPGESGEWLCFGATVQDITDSHYARLWCKVLEYFANDLADIAQILAELAQRYCATPMCGRTHGQPGLPISFGYKVAVWLDEILRHRQRLGEIRPRLIVGQLAGGVGTLSALGPEALTLQQRFCRRLGIGVPAISWTSARDRLAEWAMLLSFICSTADKIGHEIYNLQRPEIGEVSEGFVSGTVGSITMPQKRNPEISEHLGTLARLVRHQAGFMAENLVHGHERDGRSWKGEWALLPSSCLAAGKALALLKDLLGSLQVHEVRMLKNLQATAGSTQAEAIMLDLAKKVGKQSAHATVYRIAMQAAETNSSFQQVLLQDAEVCRQLGAANIDALIDARPYLGAAPLLVGRVLEQNLELQPAARDFRQRLNRLPRHVLAVVPTPLLPLQKLGGELGVTLYCKRDDLLGFGLGGNKVRGLEYLVADALAQQADILVTGAGVQSNHVRATAAAAAHVGLQALAVYWGEVPSSVEGNYRLARLFGVQTAFTGSSDRASVDSAILAHCRRLQAEGRRPYAIPRGGACPMGVFGHALAAFELYRQCVELGLKPDCVLMAAGSGGTLAGWLLATRALGLDWRIEGVTVSREVEELRPQIAGLARDAARLLDLDWMFLPEDVIVHSGFIGEGYGIPSAAGSEAIHLMARSEGLLLDPTYTGKAFACLLQRIRLFPQHYRQAIFIHSGGEPAFFAGDGR